MSFHILFGCCCVGFFSLKACCIYRHMSKSLLSNFNFLKTFHLKDGACFVSTSFLKVYWRLSNSFNAFLIWYFLSLSNCRNWSFSLNSLSLLLCWFFWKCQKLLWLSFARIPIDWFMASVYSLNFFDLVNWIDAQVHYKFRLYWYIRTGFGF